MRVPPIPKWLLKTPVKIATRNITETGGIAYSVVLNTLCRLEPVSNQTYNVAGEDVKYNWTLWFTKKYDANNIPLTDGKVIFEDGSEHKIIAVETQLHPDGTIHHTKLMMQ